MKIKLVFSDWQKNGQSVYSEQSELSEGNFHSGTTFDADIDLGTDEKEFKRALINGYNPVFYVIE